MPVISASSSRAPDRVIKFLWAFVVCTLLHFVCSRGQAQNSVPAAELVARVVKNELEDRAHQYKWMYRMEKWDGSQTLTEKVVETKSGPLFRLVAIDGRPLNAEERQREDSRINHILRDPGPLLKLQREREEDELKLEKLLRLMPVVFVSDYDGVDGDLVRVKFRPNPGYSPTTYEARVVHSLSGAMLINVRKERLAKLSGQLIERVQFGYGLLGRLESGRIDIARVEVGSVQWKTALIDIQVAGHLLLFKTLSKKQHEVRSDFRTVPDSLTLAEASELLRSD
jgi:hypothetical protein